MTSLEIGKTSPALASHVMRFSATDATGVAPFEIVAVGLNSADIDLVGQFDRLAIGGTGLVAVGVSATTSGGTLFRAQWLNASGPKLVVQETVGSTLVTQVVVPLPELPTNPFVIELLVDRSAGTARELIRTQTGDSLSPDLALSSAVTEKITSIGLLTFVENGVADSIDVDVLGSKLFTILPPDPVPALSGPGIVVLVVVMEATRLLLSRRRAT
jgi:hypothetical protein